MNVTLWTLLLFFRAAVASRLLVRNHTCVPSSYTKICILESLHYKSNSQEEVIHHFPSNQSHIRIVSESRSSGDSREVLDLNTKLYTLLGKPAILEILDHAVWNLQIPRGLHRGIFQHSYTRNLTVESGTETPVLVYLDLTNNNLRNISSIVSLVNLEVLLLSDNIIASLEPSTFKNLTKLHHLDLSYNDLSQLSITIFPKSLIYLNLYRNEISSLDNVNLNYPSLEVLNIERNKVPAIDGPALMLAMPKLKMVRIGGNPLRKDDLQQILVLFQRHNISVRDEADEAACWSSDEIYEGVCIAMPDPPRTVIWEVLLSLSVVLGAIALVATLRWMFLVMNRL